MTTTHQLDVLDRLIWDVSQQLRALVRRREAMAAELRKPVQEAKAA